MGVFLIVLTLWSYRKKTAACDKKHIILAGTELLLLVGLTLAQNGIIRYFHSLPYERVNDIWYFWLRSCGDYSRLCLLVALLVQGCALIRQRRVDKRHNSRHLYRFDLPKPSEIIDFRGLFIEKFGFCICYCCWFQGLSKPAFSLFIAAQILNLCRLDVSL